MSFYAGLSATSTRLLAKFGAAATLARNTPGAYDPATGAAPITTTTQSVTAVVLPYGDKMVDGSNILSTDRQAFISASATTEPRAGDVLTWDGADYSVVKVKTLAPGQVACIYECQVRSG